MKKRLLCLILIILMAFCLCACPEEKEEGAESSFLVSVVESRGEEPLEEESSTYSSIAKPEESTEESEAPDTKSSFYVMFIDVGQADAALVMCDGHYMLIDGGNVADSNRIYTVLKNRGVEKLDYVIATHSHEDHIGGLSGAFNACTVETLFSPITESDSTCFSIFKETAEKKGISLTVPQLDTSYNLGVSRFTVLAPRQSYDDPNNTSIVIRLEYGDTSFLFTGDAERSSEQDMINADCNLSADLLKVGHHGSNSSSSYQFLREVMPTYAIISVELGNDYGHPHDEVLERLADADVTVYRTDELGDIICHSDGQTLSFEFGTENDKSEYPYIANSKSGVLHRSTCSGLPKEENRAYFYTVEDAERAGYTKKCDNCMN